MAVRLEATVPTQKAPCILKNYRSLDIPCAGVAQLPLISEPQAPKAYRGILLGRPHATECCERSAKRMARTEHPIC